MKRHRPTEFIAVLLMVAWAATCQADLHADAMAAAKRAVSFLTDHVSTEGGYLWRYSSDLSLREGEGIVTTQTVWVQPPGTPAVGGAFVKLYQATHDKQFLEAARRAADALRRGQMRSGGWQAMVEFEPERRKKWSYRIDPPGEKARDQSSLDDDKTQSAIRFLVRLDQAVKFQDQPIHEMAKYALDGLLSRGQLSGGGFPQVWTSERIEPRQESADQGATAQLRASYPESWLRTYPAHQNYWYRYTLNDNLAPDVIDTLFLAGDVYQEDRYRDAALRVADFLLLAQMPDPQPAWAQQYSFTMQPIWARKFEPPAITGGESQGVIEALMSVYERTGAKKYLEPIPRALDYLETSKLPDGRLARFYELKTNRPLYFDTSYQLTYDDSDMPTHYGFKVPSRLNRLRQKYELLSRQPADAATKRDSEQSKRPSDARIREVMERLDVRGAWLSNQGLRYHKKAGQVIDMRLTVDNLNLLANYLSSGDTKPKRSVILSRGEKLFNSYCAACHQIGGQGVEGRVPPLDGSPWVSGSQDRLIRIVLNGLRGPIEIQGQTYNLEMPSFRMLFKDDDIAAILTFARHRYGHAASPVAIERVARVRERTRKRVRYWTVPELIKIP